MDWLDELEFWLLALLAGLLLIASPLWVAWRFAHVQRYAEAIFCLLLWGSCSVAFVRDLRQSRFSWVTGFLLGLWFILTLVLHFVLA